MRNIKNKAFTLVELLVVITILSILSVVAYQSFGGATDKANNVTKKSNIATLGNTIGLFNTEKNFYPMPQAKSNTNLWGYNSGSTASTSNTIRVTYNDQEIATIASGDGGGIINGTGANTSNQIAAKGVIGTNGTFNKKYLKKDIYDTQLGDIKLTGETDKKMIDYGIGKYVYAVYARAATAANWNVSGSKGTYFELATTLKDTDGEGYITYLEGNYSKDNFNNPNDYPESLIGLKDGQKDDSTKTTLDSDQGIPYPIDGFAK